MTVSCQFLVLNAIRQSAKTLGLLQKWTCKDGGDPKHTTQTVKKWLKENNVTILESKPESHQETVKGATDKTGKPSKFRGMETVKDKKWFETPLETKTKNVVAIIKII